MPTVFIPAQLRDLTGGARKVTVPGKTLKEVLEHLDAKHPGMKSRLLDDEGESLNPYIEIGVGDSIATLGLLTPVAKDAEVHILPNVSGGAAKPHGGEAAPGRVRRGRAGG